MMRYPRSLMILAGFMVCAAPTSALTQQKPSPPHLPTSGAAIAVAPAKEGEAAAWVTNGSAVFYCVRRPPADPSDPKQNPAGRVNCSGGAITQPMQ
jgi:hypothetical protein